jgi:hypothetical protein
LVVYRITIMQRKSIEELRIEIDKIKRDRQVAEIADTEYLQDLQAHKN